MEISRRDLVRRSLGAGAAITLLKAETTQAMQSQGSMPAPATTRPAQTAPLADAAQLHWLEGAPSKVSPGTSWGVPWPRGARKAEDRFTLGGAPVQTWPLAYWPDGSVKWTGHATTATAADLTLAIDKGNAVDAATPALRVEEAADSFIIDTGVVRITFPREGDALIRSIDRGGKPIAENVRLVAQREDRTDEATPKRENFTSEIESVELEQRGPVRAVVKVSGKHAGNGRSWLPFVVRLYVHAGSDAVRLFHSFVFDGDQNEDFLSGLGVTASVPMRGAMHDRHVRFTGEGKGLWAEAVRGLSAQRRDPGQPFVDAQIAGRAVPPLSEMASSVRDRLELIPAWGDHTLWQPSPDAFEIRKRTKSQGVTWIKSAIGGRASGVGYVGSPEGGVVFGLRDFWQRYPTQLDIRGANTDRAQVTAWMYSPDAPPMDLRGYHDGMGMDTFAKQIEGLNITYEDWEPGFSDPHGVARSSEITLWAVAATPPREDYAEYARAVQSPALLVCEPERYQQIGLFGGLWGVVDRSTPTKAKVEDALDWQFDYYVKQRDQQRWYGFWDYGDVMHSYDPHRHVWRYDNGGMAWANSELSPDLWLWYSFLRSGRADVFRFAEAMTRHTGEVDVYHAGRWKGLGSRHNVLHWGCSAKQLRISTPVYRRFYYYLTADERVGDLMRELLDADQTFITLDPIRKVRRDKYEPKPEALSVGLHTDWGSLAIIWLTELERSGDQRAAEKLINGMRTIGELPNGFFTAGATYDINTGKYSPPADTKAVGISHLGAVFGLPEICAELIALFPEQTKFRDAWIQYCTLYNAPREERQAALGDALRGNTLTTAHSRLTAYAAVNRDPKLAARAWNEFKSEGRWANQRYDPQVKRLEGPTVLRPIDEAAWVGTNDVSTWGLAAIENLHLIGKEIPETLTEPATRPTRDA